MPKFRKKPIVVEAFQWFPEMGAIGPVHQGKAAGNAYYYVRTFEGTLNVSRGDWIITGVQGETHPCKPSIFEAMYELV